MWISTSKFLYVRGWFSLRIFILSREVVEYLLLRNRITLTTRDCFSVIYQKPMQKNSFFFLSYLNCWFHVVYFINCINETFFALFNYFLLSNMIGVSNNLYAFCHFSFYKFWLLLFLKFYTQKVKTESLYDQYSVCLSICHNRFSRILWIVVS